MKKKLKNILPFLIIFLGIAAAFIMIRSRPKIEQKSVSFPPPLVRVQTIALQEIQLNVSSQGTVSPRTESDMVSQVAGQVIAVSPQFAAGGFFNKGEILITIDPRDYEFALARLKAELAQARLRLVQEEGEAKIAREEWERLEKEETANPLVLRQPQLDQAKAALEAAQASLKKAELDLERTRIKAPFDGRVRTKQVDVGEYVAPGLPLAVIYAVDFVEVRLPVPDEEMAYLECCLDYQDNPSESIDLDVLLKANYAQNEFSWKGKIVRVEGEIDPLSRMVTLVAQVKDPYSRDQKSDRPPLAVGLFVRADIMGGMARDVVVIPRSALRGSDQVLVIDSEERLHFRQVEVFRKSADTVIISSGLAAGERLCLSALEAVVDGMQVRVQSSSQAAADTVQKEST
jgi:RND family efflux transporter MFP subunit